jgi:GNAT superfamily N-acetyltransferase
MTSAATAVVREAREQDLPRILTLLYELSLSSSHPEAAPRDVNERHIAVLQELLNSPYFDLLVVEAEGDVIGTLHLYIVPSLTKNGVPWAVVEHVVVDERHRSKGYGELLMAEAIRRARAAGAERMSLGSNLRRVDSHRFYERLGFQATQKGFLLLLK